MAFLEFTTRTAMWSPMALQRRDLERISTRRQIFAGHDIHAFNEASPLSIQDVQQALLLGMVLVEFHKDLSELRFPLGHGKLHPREEVIGLLLLGDGLEHAVAVGTDELLAGLFVAVDGMVKWELCLRHHVHECLRRRREVVIGCQGIVLLKERADCEGDEGHRT